MPTLNDLGGRFTTLGNIGGIVRGSWYSQLPQYGWRDPGDRPGSNALGVPDYQQGIALPSRRTLGQWFDVTDPTGRVFRLQQTDIGPAKWTGRGIDISAAAAHQMGYTPKTFPTDARFSYTPAGQPPPVGWQETVSAAPGGVGYVNPAQMGPGATGARTSPSDLIPSAPRSWGDIVAESLANMQFKAAAVPQVPSGLPMEQEMRRFTPLGARAGVVPFAQR